MVGRHGVDPVAGTATGFSGDPLPCLGGGDVGADSAGGVPRTVPASRLSRFADRRTARRTSWAS